ncbi:transcription initiation factor IID, 18 kDa subunit [Ascobolus immersus RN42]|uniref:Transcription initiation factor TFIID subunit 13 n=1 Tax=Ascobolus immersus RN42 TaxID=1160509 RepID=A0A3N4IBD6_ASCIM|nr:transcription initiation factor IID, 18 kDa subunit [Ascobolus immersus RN42]
MFLTVRTLMYGFGDDPNPLNESVAVLDEIVTDFIVDMCHDAAKVATHARRNKIKVDDFKFALRRDQRKLGRVEELLVLSKEIADARKQFDDKPDAVTEDAK